MRGDARSMKVLRPRSVDDALELYRRHPDAVPLAGGTDFMVAWNGGSENAHSRFERHHVVAAHPSCGLDASRRCPRDTLAIAARASREKEVPASRRRLRHHRQTQSRGTLGGNIANASPAGDTFAPLAVYEATVRLRSAAGRRKLFMKVFAGVKKTHLRPGELIESVELDFPPKPARQLFRKVGTRSASAISKTVAAVARCASCDSRSAAWLDRATAIRRGVLHVRKKTHAAGRQRGASAPRSGCRPH